MKRECEIHLVPLLPDRVAISFGLPSAPPEGFAGAERIGFPNAATVVLGGCVIDLEAEHEVEVFYCPNCRNSEKIWHLRHRQDSL